jgi:membrane complex biogenesis BtpA family protein
MHSLFPDVDKPVIGMLHLPPLPGSPGFAGDLDAIYESVLRDARALQAGGVHGLMMENFGDVPFYPGRVPAYVVAQMTAIAVEVRRAVQLPLGINVLRNDGLSALAIAVASKADFIRVNVLCGARVCDQGLLQGIAHDLLRERAILRAERIKILADVDVKHSAALAARPIADEVDDTIHRGLADGVIVSGAGTGKPADLGKLKAVKAAAGDRPVYLGSGVTAASVNHFLPHADGFIVGTAFKQSGNVANPVDVDRVKELVGRLGGPNPNDETRNPNE